MSNFIDILPTRLRTDAVYLGDRVRVHFMMKNPERPILRLSIGKDLLKRAGIDPKKDTVVLSVDQDNDKLWLVRKHPNNLGWKLYSLPKAQHPNYYFIQMAWKRSVPPELRDGHNKFVKYADIYQGGVRIGLPGVTADEFTL